MVRDVLLMERGTRQAVIGWDLPVAEVDKVVPVDGALDADHVRGGHGVEVVAVVLLGGAVDLVAAVLTHQHTLQDLVW